MSTRAAMRLSIVALACVPFVLAAQAAPASTAPVTCNDGTQSIPGSKSPCSGHGGVRGAVQVNAPPAQPSSGGGAVAVNAPTPGSPPAPPANVVHCMDGTTEPKTVGPVARLSPYCQGHGGVNDKAVQVGVSSHPTGSVAVSTPPVGTPASTTRTVHCKDGTEVTVPKKTQVGVDPCKGHGGVSDHAVTVGEQPNAGGAVVVNQAPVGGTATGVHAQTSHNTIPCNDGTMQVRSATPCAGHGGPREKPVQVGVQPGATPPAPPAPSSATTMRAATSVSHVPLGATARCKDGTYTTNKSRKDGCAGHGGVQTSYGTTP